LAKGPLGCLFGDTGTRSLNIEDTWLRLNSKLQDGPEAVPGGINRAFTFLLSEFNILKSVLARTLWKLDFCLLARLKMTQSPDWTDHAQRAAQPQS
jgi:hypothetical protein